MMTSDNDYKNYIDGLKGFACLLIMFGHFLGVYKYAQDFAPNIYCIDIILSSRLSFLLDEEYWLGLFFIISGYLVSRTKIETLKDIIIKTIKRFLRFALPIFFSYFVIYIIYIVIGFHTFETKTLFQCDWFQKFYCDYYDFMDVIVSPFEVIIKGNCILCRPYWVLKYMFIASMIIYLIKYFYKKSNFKNFNFLFLIMFLIITISYYISEIISSCLIGMLVYFYEDKNCKKNHYSLLCLLLISFCAIFMSKKMLSYIFFSVLLIIISKIEFLYGIFSSNILLFFGSLNWGIYSFHWPIYCSIGALILSLTFSNNLIFLYILSCLFSFFFTIFLSFIYNIIFEKFVDNIYLFLNSYL